jgi:phage-related protein
MESEQLNPVRWVVLHAFQKKSKSGIATPKKDIDVIHQRLAAAKRDYEERQKEHEDQKKNR